ncbi:MAG: thioredoxin fold domain-containing protein [Alistipes sp.]|nr:thioredoxin fold domain-containing protein [Alistipes sp.]
MEAVKQLTKKEFIEKIADIDQGKGAWKFRGERPAVIDFFASWCGPCKALAPTFEELAADYQYKDRIDFYKVDIDREPELAEAFGVRSVPTLLFIPMQGMPQMTTGVRPKVDLKRIIDSALMKK